jgi:predicted ester cyclase
VPATNREIRVDAIILMRIAHGRIAEHWCFWDTLGLMRQIAAKPALA